MVFAHAYVVARMVDGASLANEYVARFGYFAAEEFYTEPFAVRFASVL